MRAFPSSVSHRHLKDFLAVSEIYAFFIVRLAPCLLQLDRSVFALKAPKMGVDSGKWSFFLLDSSKKKNGRKWKKKEKNGKF